MRQPFSIPAANSAMLYGCRTAGCWICIHCVAVQLYMRCVDQPLRTDCCATQPQVSGNLTEGCQCVSLSIGCCREDWVLLYVMMGVSCLCMGLSAAWVASNATQLAAIAVLSVALVAACKMSCRVCHFSRRVFWRSWSRSSLVMRWSLRMHACMQHLGTLGVLHRLLILHCVALVSGSAAWYWQQLLTEYDRNHSSILHVYLRACARVTKATCIEYSDLIFCVQDDRGKNLHLCLHNGSWRSWRQRRRIWCQQRANRATGSVASRNRNGDEACFWQVREFTLLCTNPTGIWYVSSSNNCVESTYNTS